MPLCHLCSVSKMFNAIKLFIYFLILSVGGLSSYGLSQLHVRLFLHYLLGSGENINNSFFSTQEIKEIKSACRDSTLSKIYSNNPNWYVVDTAKTKLQFSLGSFGCSTNGTKAVDVYDFGYSSTQDHTVLESLVCLYKPTLDSNTILTLEPVNVGRCIVNKGYGKPFEIDITF